jgi:hypothetical protein
MTEERLSAFFLVIKVFGINYHSTVVQSNLNTPLSVSGQMDSLDVVTVNLSQMSDRECFYSI